MTEQLKPVLCGCGGSPIIRNERGKAVYVQCVSCGTRSIETNRAEAIEAWNRAMGGKPERKKGKWIVQPSTGEDRPFIWWKCSECGHVIFSETERDRKEFHAFCGRCGAEMRSE